MPAPLMAEQNDPQTVPLAGMAHSPGAGQQSRLVLLARGNTFSGGTSTTRGQAGD